MNEKDKEILELYSQLKNKAAKLNEEISNLAPEIEKIFKRNQFAGNDPLSNDKKIKTEFGTFSVGTRVSYKFPERITHKQEEVNKEKEKAIQTGEAETKAVSTYIIFRKK